MALTYITGGGKNTRYYKIKKNKDAAGHNVGEVSRISCQEYDDSNKNVDLGRHKPNIGDKVIIIMKPYHMYNCKTGIVKNVLTNKAIHTRGHKVRLNSGEIGRTLKIIKNN